MKNWIKKLRKQFQMSEMPVLEEFISEEIIKELIEDIPNGLEVRTVVGGDEPDIEYQDLKQQLRDKWL